MMIGWWLHTACHLVFLCLWVALPCICVAWWHLILLQRTYYVYTRSDWDHGAIIHLDLITALIFLRFNRLVWLLRIQIVRSRLGWLLSIERWKMTCAVMLHDVLTWAEFPIVIGLLGRQLGLTCKQSCLLALLLPWAAIDLKDRFILFKMDLITLALVMVLIMLILSSGVDTDRLLCLISILLLDFYLSLLTWLLLKQLVFIVA